MEVPGSEHVRRNAPCSRGVSRLAPTWKRRWRTANTRRNRKARGPLHPAAVGVLLDALREGSRGVQVIVTSHSPDLLDDDSIPTDAVLAVVAEDGRTEIGPIDSAGRKVLHEHLFTAGELLRLDQLRPSDEARQIAASEQLRLFGE